VPPKKGTPRRSDHSGTWRELDSGSWNVSGRFEGVRYSATGKTKAEARAEQRRKIDEIRSGLAAERRRADTVGGLVDALVARKEGRLEPATVTAYKRAARYIKEGLGEDTPILALAGPEGAARVLAAYDQLAQRLSGARLRETHLTLNQALRMAADEGRAVPTIPSHIRPPRKSAPKPRAIPEEHVAALLEAARNDDSRWHALWALAVCSGLRLGELLALEWADVRETSYGGVVHVRRALTEDAERRPRIKEYPKTASGVRVVPIEPPPYAAVAALPRLPVEPEWGDLIFASPRTRGPLPQTSAAHAFARHWKAAKLPGRAHPHLLRHTYAKSQLERGANLAQLAAWLGHTDGSTTLRLYAHWQREDPHSRPLPVAGSYRIE
jgi:integrase